MAEENKDNAANEPVDLSGLGSFDFTPAWARGDAADTSRFKRFEEREERREERKAFGDRKPFGGERKPFGDRKSFGERRPFGDRKPMGERKPFEGDRDRGVRSDDAHRPSGERKPGGERRGGFRRDDRPAREFIKPMDAEVRILPNQKELGPVIRKIQTSHLAYPLKNLAYFFLEHPEACMLRVTPRKSADGTAVQFHQCKTCGWVSTSPDELLAHVVSAHLADYYSCEEIDCEPPKGAFSCVAKCGLSGVLLGPPNLHGYDARVREMIRTRYPNMSEEEYRARIVTVRDAEAVEAWRQSAVKKTIYRLKKVPAANAEGVTESPALEREQAEAEFRRTIAPALMAQAKSVDLAADVALKCPDRAFVYACKDALAKERRFPASLFYALRGAFHHRKLVFFRAEDTRGPEFVSSVPFAPLDCEHAIPALAEIVNFVAAHPDATRASFSAEQAQHLEWLIEKGHLVGYFNGALAIPADHPKYRPPRKPVMTPPVAPAPAPAAEAPVAEAPAAEAPAAEAPAAEAPAAEAPAAEAPAAE